MASSNHFAARMAGKDTEVEARLDGLESALAGRVEELRAAVTELRAGSNTFAASAAAALDQERQRAETQLAAVAQQQQASMQQGLQAAYDALLVQLQTFAGVTAGVASAQREQQQPSVQLRHQPRPPGSQLHQLSWPQ